MLALCLLGIPLYLSGGTGTSESDSWSPTFGWSHLASPCGGTSLKYSLNNSDLEDLHKNPALNTAGITPSLHQLNFPLS